jgi:hypothetical protein
MGKEVTLKNIELIGAMQSINELLELDDLSTKVNYNLTKNYMKYEQSLKTYTKCEQELLNKYAIKDESGNFKIDENGEPKFAPNNRIEYFKKRDELLSVEDTIDILNIKISLLPEKIGKGKKLRNIMFMIDDDLEEEAKPESK